MWMTGGSSFRFIVPMVVVAILLVRPMASQLTPQKPVIPAQSLSMNLPLASDNYVLGPDSQRHAGVSVGQQFS